MTELELLARIAGLDKTSPYDIVRETFRGISGGGDEAWKKFLHDGFLTGSAAKTIKANLNPPAIGAALSTEVVVASPSKDKLEVGFYRDYRMHDSRVNNNGWMQELPDPITKLTWAHVILMS